MIRYPINDLSSIAEVISGFAFKSTWFGSGNHKVIRISDLIDNKVSLANAVNFNPDNHQIADRYRIKTGDILVALSGATTGKIGIAGNDAEGAFLNQRVAIVRGYVKENTNFLSYILRGEHMQRLLPSAEGAAQPNLSPKMLENLQVPIPPIDDQRRIAARLKVQLAEVEKACKAAETQLSETTRLADSIIQDSINRTKIEKYRLGDVLEEIKAGIGKNWLSYPALGATREGLAPAKEPPGKNPQRYKPAFPGTVFYNPMRILIGSIAFVDDDDAPGITSPDYVVLKGKDKAVDSRWFYYWLRSPLGEQCINSLARGAVRERMLFNRLAEGKIELPDYGIQQTASIALAELKPMRQAFEQKLNEINLMPSKILAQAFEI